MRIEFLRNGSADCPLIRIYGNEPDVCQNFRRAFEQLAQGTAAELCLTDLPGVQPIKGCCLIAKLGGRDKGVIHNEGSVFQWVLTQGGWNTVAGLTEPFCHTQNGGFQWLDQSHASEARVLISTSSSGCW
jgi:hypothetical protein